MTSGGGGGGGGGGNYSSIHSKVLNNSDCTDKGAVVREDRSIDFILFFAMAVSRVLDHFSRYKQEGRVI